MSALKAKFNVSFLVVVVLLLAIFFISYASPAQSVGATAASKSKLPTRLKASAVLKFMLGVGYWPEDGRSQSLKGRKFTLIDGSSSYRGVRFKKSVEFPFSYGGVVKSQSVRTFITRMAVGASRDHRLRVFEAIAELHSQRVCVDYIPPFPELTGREISRVMREIGYRRVIMQDDLYVFLKRAELLSLLDPLLSGLDTEELAKTLSGMSNQDLKELFDNKLPAKTVFVPFKDSHSEELNAAEVAQFFTEELGLSPKKVHLLVRKAIKRIEKTQPLCIR